MLQHDDKDERARKEYKYSPTSKAKSNTTTSKTTLLSNIDLMKIPKFVSKESHISTSLLCYLDRYVRLYGSKGSLEC